MFLSVVEELRKKPAHEAARLLGNARNYITNDAFINILNLYDINNKKNDGNLIKQINMFASIPELKMQVNAWLHS